MQSLSATLFPFLAFATGGKNLVWSFGVSTSPATGVNDLSDGHRKVVFYTAAHSGVLFDYANNRQYLLQGHASAISASASSSDRRWLATADAGPSPLLILWDTLPHLSAPTSSNLANANSAYALPVRTLFDPHGGRGVAALEFSRDALYLYTLSAVGLDPFTEASPNVLESDKSPKTSAPSTTTSHQTLCIWDWTDPSPNPLITVTLKTSDPQTVLRVSPDDPGLLMTNGTKEVWFWTWDRQTGEMVQKIGETNVDIFHRPPPIFLHSTFLPTTPYAVSTTASGELVLWSDRPVADFAARLPKGSRGAAKYVKIGGMASGTQEKEKGPTAGEIGMDSGSKGGCVEVVGGKYIVVGGTDGAVRVYDFQFRILTWFEKMAAGPIISMSFAGPVADGEENEVLVPHLQLPQFVVLTSRSKIVLAAHSLRALEPAAAPLSTQGTWKSGQVVTSKKPDLPAAKGTGGGGKLVDGAAVPREGPGRGRGVHKTDGAAPSGIAAIDPSLAGLETDYFVKVLVVGQMGSVTGVATSPRARLLTDGTRPRQLVAVVGMGGCVQVFDASTRALQRSRILEQTTEKVFDDQERTDSVYGPTKKKKVMVTEHLPALCVAWCPDRSVLAVGLANGHLRILSAGTLEDVADFDVGKDPVERVLFSDDGDNLACADGGCAVSYFASRHRGHNPANETVERRADKGTWCWVGKARAHSGKIVSLLFLHRESPQDHLMKTENEATASNRDECPRLLSVATDKNVAEYDLRSSSEADGLQIESVRKVSQTAIPLCAIHAPGSNLFTPSTTSQAPASAPVVTDPWILFGTSHFKFRIHSADSFICRKTVLGPTFGGPICEMAVVPATEPGGPGSEQYIVWRSNEKLVGLMKLPLDGNPNRFTAIVAHPGQIVNLVLTTDPPTLLTAGGPDGVVNQWTLNTGVLDSQIAQGGAGFEPFLRMLDDQGVEGPVFKEVEDYFYFSQLRAGGEDYSKGERPICDTVPVQELESIMAALGYYQTVQESEEMRNEVKMGNFELTGKLVTEVGLEDIIKFVEVTQYEVEAALEATKEFDKFAVEKNGISESDSGDHRESDGTVAFFRSSLVQMLQQHGEPMQRAEFDELVHTLLSSQSGLIPPRFMLPPPLPGQESLNGNLPKQSSSPKYAMPSTITGREFISSVLGMQSVDDEGNN
ncbi:YVTN repeat-like/Quino protein amine dehydrogenase [Gonapodya prolifera JEL478]|uniref:Cilia- and flagella-associated protein 251 n=1 Tax=Gonapodya prolifera (strain JEL478) TaxID=1344416 RepID=A0A139AQE3_GONPJ|nr:YVTN repeat-like/Quino protein amine dehydrogenase [Gonapodya prolifera JEL478]|eukprot:KXS18705.1 YVTN repeat-like/Quino protein amine dehydrogenase [Gonapodya prolifera JEL478]